MSYIKKKSKRQEDRTAKDFGGLTQVASGALWGAKGDVRTDEFLIENKFTDATSYILKVAIWNKIEDEARRDGVKIPIMQIDIQDVQVVVMRLWDMQEYFTEGMAKVTSVVSPNKSFSMEKEYFKFKYLEYGVINFSSSDLILGVMRKDDFKVLLDTREE